MQTPGARSPPRFMFSEEMLYRTCAFKVLPRPCPVGALPCLGGPLRLLRLLRLLRVLFSATLFVGPLWMEENGVTADDIRSCAQRALVFPENHPQDQQPLPPCARCCGGKRANVYIGGSVSEVALSGGERGYVFESCRSHCNSSRLHLGGKVVVMLEIRRADGTVAARVRSQPVQLCSKSCRKRRARSSSPDNEADAEDSALSRPDSATPAAAPSASANTNANANANANSNAVAAAAVELQQLQQLQQLQLMQQQQQQQPMDQKEKEVLIRQLRELEFLQQQQLLRVKLLEHLLFRSMQ
eukprot:m51a1_g14640 hypothetical protein (299) ;mRNA; r:53808-55072